MGAMSLWHWLIVIIVVLLLFGGGKLSSVMGDVAHGIKAFKKGIREDETEAASSGSVKADPAKLTPPQAQSSASSATTENSAG